MQSMNQNRNKEQLLKKQSDLLIKIALHGLVIEEKAFYSMRVLQDEVKGMERPLKLLRKSKKERSSKI